MHDTAFSPEDAPKMGCLERIWVAAIRFLCGPLWSIWVLDAGPSESRGLKEPKYR